MVNMCVGVAELNNRGIASYFIPKPELPVVIGEGLTWRGGGHPEIPLPPKFFPTEFPSFSKKYLNGTGLISVMC